MTTSSRTAALALGGLVVLAVAASALVGALVFPAFSWNRDEPVYLWQVELLRSGHLVGSDGGEPGFFRPWLTAAVDGTLVSQYTLGWPLVLLGATVVFSTSRPAVAFGTVLAVVGVYAFATVAFGDRRTSLVAAGLFLACPVVLVQSGTFLGYLFTLGVGLLFLAALVHGVRTARPPLLVAAGVLVGWVFLTRPLDAVLWALAGAVSVAVEHRRSWRALVPAAGWVVIGAVPLAVLALAYNARVTGDPTTFPITAADPLDTLGFGLRRIMPANLPVDFGLVQALKGSGRNGLNVPVFLVGGVLGLVAAGAGLWLRRRDPGAWLAVAVAAVFPLGYFPFWGIFLSAAYAEYSGPYYYLPVFAPLCLLAAVALVRLFEQRRILGLAACAALAVVDVPLAAWHLDRNRDISVAQEPWRDSTDALAGDVLVFVADSGPYLLFSNPYATNGAHLDDRVLFAADRGARNLDLIERRPTRTPYLQRSSKPTWRLLEYDRPVEPTITLTPIEVVRSSAIGIRATIIDTEGAAAVSATLDDGTDVVGRSIAGPSRRGIEHTVEWTAGVAPLTDAPAPFDLSLGGDRLGELTVTVGFGASPEEAAADPRLRHVVGYRRVGGEIEVLTPGWWERLVVRRTGAEWVQAPERGARLQVAVTAARPADPTGR
ncbi:MAG TPA: hypothetical protein VM933_11010 [Acidimicrobiales bacterium]|nr:hypothetical protein [Acidimicrobiales bacterium]